MVKWVVKENKPLKLLKKLNNTKGFPI
ncbi:hypothetical protein PT2222_140109 [Paraburkholderia tropica]